MENEHLCQQLEFEYHGWQASRQAEIERHGKEIHEDMTFVEFCKARNVSTEFLRWLKSQGWG